MDRTLDDPVIRDLARRVRGEFLGMPRLRLNVRDAERLWGLDAAHAQIVLDALVARGDLACTRHVYSLPIILRTSTIGS